MQDYPTAESIAAREDWVTLVDRAPVASGGPRVPPPARPARRAASRSSARMMAVMTTAIIRYTTNWIV
ncbi:hypothetical protein [Nocardia brasiliensis]|uniref:hypothetical protein n=1 Tax=Nocardia brasiliensis TaxID=37326 RepID=UPI003D7703AB